MDNGECFIFPRHCEGIYARGNLPVQSELLQCFSIDITRRLPRRFAPRGMTEMGKVFLLAICFFGGYNICRERPPCVKGAVSEADWGIVQYRYITIPPSRLTPCHLPLHKGGFGAYNHFTNYDAIICKRRRLYCKTKMNLLFLFLKG